MSLVMLTFFFFLNRIWHYRVTVPNFQKMSRYMVEKNSGVGVSFGKTDLIFEEEGRLEYEEAVVRSTVCIRARYKCLQGCYSVYWAELEPFGSTVPTGTANRKLRSQGTWEGVSSSPHVFLSAQLEDLLWCGLGYPCLQCCEHKGNDQRVSLPVQRGL